MTKKESSNQPNNAAAPYKIQIADCAASAYEQFFHKAMLAERNGKPESEPCMMLRQIDKAIEVIIPSDPCNKKYALVGDLKAIYRLSVGRLRICWMTSPDRKQIQVIFISEALPRGADASDSRVALSRRLAAGEFDVLLQQLGIRPTSKTVTHLIQ